MSTKRLKAEIVTSGTEILLGEIVDTNAAWIAQQLRESGVNLYYKTTVGDNEPRLRAVLESGLSRSDVIIITGGLGPTADDITRDAIANATNCPLLLSDTALQTLTERFKRFDVEMTENNKKQAYLPTGAIMINNSVGTAPGFIVESDSGTIIALPGVPREMKQLMTETVLPYLRQRNGDTGIIQRRVLRTIGIGESTIDSKIADLMAGSNPTVGLAAHTAQVDVRITASADTADAAEALIDGMESTVRERIGDVIFSTEATETLETVLTKLLEASGQQIAIVESNTNGTIANRLRSADSDYNPILAAWTLESTDLPKPIVDRLGDSLSIGETFDETLVSDCVALLADATNAALSLFVLGTSGEDEGVYGSRAGETWVATHGKAGIMVHKLRYGGRDDYTMTWLANYTLDGLRRQLLAT